MEPPPLSRRRFPGCAVFLLILAVLFVMAWMGLSSLFTESPARHLAEDEENEQGVFVEVPVEGIIVDADVAGGNPVWWVEECLARAADEPDLRGILLTVNSPGGGIRASAVILDRIRRFKEEHQVPVVTLMKDVAASGGYYVSMESDWIVAHDETITASIGVIWGTMNWETLMHEKLGVEFGNVKSAPMKDIGSPDRRMTDEERALLQTFVDEAFAKFVEVVVTGRDGKGAKPVTTESVRALKSTVLTGKHAYAAGLVDELGFRAAAIAKLKGLAGIERADVIRYARPRSLLEELFTAEAPSNPIEERLRRLEFLYSRGPALMAIWER
jgi:signal peptide peptidase SppA